MKTNILFIKTAKCATQSIRQHLFEYAISRGLKVNDANYDNFFLYGPFNINTNHILNNDEYQKHFYKEIDKNLPVIRISSVRNPLDRLYSHYCYGHKFFRQGLDFNEWYLGQCKGTISDGWETPHWGDMTDNYMSNYMGIETLDDIKEKYDFIFIKEHFSDSLKAFGKLLKFDFKPKSIENKNPNTNNNYKFDSEVLSLFEERNKKDILLYKQVLKEFNDKLIL